MEAEASPYLSEGLLFKILARLPVKALLRLRTVCRSWKSIIASPEFRSLHLSTNRHSSKILLTARDYADQEWYILLDNDQHRPADPSWLGLLDFPFGCLDWTSPHIVGSINGLICVLVSQTGVPEEQPVISIMLWNPTIRRHACLPDLTLTKPNDTSIEFGYDPTTDNYKIVVLASGINVPEFHVFSLNSNAWRRGNFLVHQCPERGISFISTHAFVGGKMHWLLCKHFERGPYNSYSLYSFDVAEEVFEEVALPIEDPAMIAIPRPRVAVLGDSLFVGLASNSWTVWVQIATGGWNKLFRVEEPHGSLPTMFVCVLKNGELVMDKWQHCGFCSFLSAYDPWTRQFKELELEDLPFSHMRDFGDVESLNDHQESLVLLDCTPVGIDPAHATCCSMSCQVQIKRKTPSGEIC
ncbi:Unknown protein [Striga hermonthica]|uniref:F-box domain-containing protein n=1 Tax=Striga hermonthica TaxID=68872 RepID=A0A9N7NN71_STRHE|nr:Unknown protein [Striga hermonthica]